MARTKNVNEVVVSEEKVADSNTFKRNPETGLLNGIQYVFEEDGTVNWKAMIKKEFLVPNKDRLPAGTDTSDIDVSTLEDSQLLILLGGVKNIALLRGFTRVDYDVINAREEYVAVKCTINWIGNFETENIPVEFSALADAHYQNTSGFGNKFLMAIAENRAFVRAVRNFLRINITGQDEIDPSSKNKNDSHTEDESQPTNPAALLNKTMAAARLTLDAIKAKLIEEGVEEAKEWGAIDDIPRKRIFELIERIKRKTAPTKVG